ncbi:alpha/beta hydrolase [Bacillus paramycoides]|uniref:Alpha/beta hydrolase n=1 Tax=Bacillus paramycoides TaxID=2026194 RepID=A0ABU6N3B0_9BACI|nr:alpha/beta hydrolase [Bacillus paramycoides]
MKLLKELLSFFTGIFITIISVLLAIISFGLLVYPTNEYVAVVLSLVFVFVVTFYLNKLRRKIFNLVSSRKPLNAILTTAVLAVAMIFIFWVPTKTFESTETVIEKYGINPELITVHTGDKVAVYVHQPLVSNGQDPILFISGGPGGYPTHQVKQFLDEYARLGYTVYTYDPIGVMESPLPKKTSAYSMTHEVEVVNDILKHYKIDKVNLIANSYGGNVASRFIDQYPEQVNAYLSVDTAPLYTMNANYPGQEKDKAFMQTVQETRVDPSSKKTQSITSYASVKQLARIGYGMYLIKILGLDDIPYGNYEEYDYFMSLLVNSATGGLSKDGKVTRHMNLLANILITDSLDKSPDFTKELKKKDTPPVLVVHPEYGVVPWQIHYQYREYFKDVRFAIAPGAGHGVWGTQSGKDILVRNGDALFKGKPIPDEYTSTENPFPPIQK